MTHVPNSTERYIEEKQGISNLVFKFHKYQGKTQRSLCWLNRTSSKPDLTEYLPRTSKISFLPYVGKILNFFSKKTGLKPIRYLYTPPKLKGTSQQTSRMK